MDSLSNALLKTILYSDLFDFPLSNEEVFRYLAGDKAISQSTITRRLHKLTKTKNSLIVSSNGFYCLRSRETLILRRKQEQPEVKRKLQLASKAATALSAITTILFIGISGSLGAGKASKHDDIDFFIITKKGTLFTTRLLVLMYLELLGMRRKRQDHHAPDKICCNLFIDETKLYWDKPLQDIYTAHEIAQLLPLFEREQMYRQFFDKNAWISTFLPNATARPFQSMVQKENLLSQISFALMLLCEKPTCWLQKTIMKRHQTKETIKKDFLALHPNDYRSKTLLLLRLKCKKVGLLTKP